jgi:hypothetical protein
MSLEYKNTPFLKFEIKAQVEDHAQDERDENLLIQMVKYLSTEIVQKYI